MESNGQGWVRMLVGLLVSCIKAFLKCSGSGMLTIAFGREFQSLIVGGKYEHLAVLTGVDSVECFIVEIL